MGFLKDFAGSVANAARNAATDEAGSASGFLDSVKGAARETSLNVIAAAKDTRKQNESDPFSLFEIKVLDRVGGWLSGVSESSDDGLFRFETDSAELSKLMLGSLIGIWDIGIETEKYYVVNAGANAPLLNERGRSDMVTTLRVLLADCENDEASDLYTELLDELVTAECYPDESAVSGQAVFNEPGMLWVMLATAMSAYEKYDGGPVYGLTPYEFANIIARNYRYFDPDFEEFLVSSIPSGPEWTGVRIALGLPEEPASPVSAAESSTVAGGVSDGGNSHLDESLTLTMTSLQYGRLANSVMGGSLRNHSDVQTYVAQWMIDNMHCLIDDYEAQVYERISRVLESPDFPEDEKQVWVSFLREAPDQLQPIVDADAPVQVVFSDVDTFWLMLRIAMLGEITEWGIGFTPSEFEAIITDSKLTPDDDWKGFFSSVLEGEHYAWNGVRTALGLPEIPDSHQASDAWSSDYSGYVDDPEVPIPAEQIFALVESFDPAIVTFWPAGVDTSKVSTIYLVGEDDVLADRFIVAPSFNGTLYDYYRGFNTMAEDEGLAWRSRYRMFQDEAFFCLEFANLTGKDWARYYLVMFASQGESIVEVYKHPSKEQQTAEEREWAKSIRLAVKSLLGAMPFSATETMVANY